MAVKFSISNILTPKRKKILVIALLLVTSASALAASTYFSYKKQQDKVAAQKAAEEERLKQQQAQQEPKIIIDRSKYKAISVDSDSIGRDNPFDLVQDGSVPTERLMGDNLLVAPPTGGIEESEAGSVMSTTISGIMYEESNPCAIINIEGTEYFVKRNDVVNNYKILAIKPNEVVVKYGKNIYKAGVAETLTEVESNSNIVNLGNKFGGNNQGNIPINIRKR